MPTLLTKTTLTENTTCVKMEAGMGVMFPQAKECQSASVLPEARVEAWNRFFPTALGRNQP